MPNNVLMFGNYAHYSGALEVFRNIARELTGDDWRFSYLYHIKPEREIRPDMSMFDEVLCVDETGTSYEGRASLCADIANRFDLVHTSLIPLDWRFLFKRSCVRPMIETYHSIDGWNAAWKQYELQLTGGVDKPPNVTVGVSRSLTQTLKRCLGGARVQSISNGVPIPPVPFHGGKYVTYCGRISPGKGLETWLQIAVALRKKHPTYRYQWVGDISPHSEPWLLECLRNACPWLEITGYTPDTLLYYARSAVLMLTSPSEGLPMCILEAMAHGVPSISLDVGDVREAIGEFACRNVDQVYNMMDAMLHNPFNAERARMTRSNAISWFSADHMARHYREVYESCL